MRYFAIGALLACASLAHAETGLAITCVKPGVTSGTLISPTPNTRSCENFEVYRRPLPDSLVRSGGPGEVEQWGPQFAWRTFKDIPDTQFVERCETNIRSRTKLPQPWTSAGDPCKVWSPVMKAGILYVLAEGPGPVKLSWSKVDKNEDDTPLAVAFKYIIMGGLRGQTQTGLWSGTQLNVDILQPKVGDNCYNVYVETTVRSKPSATACKYVTFPAPTDGKIEGPTQGSIER